MTSSKGDEPRELETLAARIDTTIHSFVHCKACGTRGQTERLSAGLSRTGVVIECKKHGLIVHFSPEELAHWLTLGVQCDCCPGGRHRS